MPALSWRIPEAERGARRFQAGAFQTRRAGPSPGEGARSAVRSVLLAALAALFAAGGLAAQGTTFHVATTGSDANDGSAGAPFRSVQRGVLLARPGDTILVHAGTYDGMINVTTSGTERRPITLRGAGDGVATLRANLPRRSCAETDPARDRTIEILNGVDYWILQDLTVEGGIFVSGTDLRILSDNVRNRSLPGRGLYDPEGARNTITSLGANPTDGIQILESRISGRGVYVAAGRDGRIEGNEIHDIDCGTGAAIWLNRFSDGWTVRQNHVHDIAASSEHYMSEGIRMGGASMYNLIEDNTVERANGNGRGIATDVHAGWNVIRRNRAAAADQGLSEQSAGWGNQWLENVAEDNRRFGFNIYGQSDGPHDPNTPSLMQVRCNVTVDNPIGLSIGSVGKSDFEDNDVGTASLTDGVRDEWGALGNTWNGGSTPPPPSPPRPPLEDCTPGPTVPRIWGDLNMDGVVDGTDATLILNHVAGLATPDADLSLADVNADDRVTTRDALILLHFVQGGDIGSSRVGTPVD
jgi:hypothetical protein